jgi:hypothetical protein
MGELKRKSGSQPNFSTIGRLGHFCANTVRYLDLPNRLSTGGVYSRCTEAGQYAVSAAASRLEPRACLPVDYGNGVPLPPNRLPVSISTPT